MREFISTTCRKTMNAVFDVGVTGVVSIAGVVLVVILWHFKII